MYIVNLSDVHLFYSVSKIHLTTEMFFKTQSLWGSGFQGHKLWETMI